MKTSDDEIEKYLEHHGVKGMKWGVRKQASRITLGKPVPHTKSEDAVAAKSILAKAKASKTSDVLSNKEIQTFLTRVNLEMQYSKLSASKSKKAARFVTNFLTNAGKQQVSMATNKGLTKGVSKALSLGKA